MQSHLIFHCNKRFGLTVAFHCTFYPAHNSVNFCHSWKRQIRLNWIIQKLGNSCTDTLNIKSKVTGSDYLVCTATFKENFVQLSLSLSMLHESPNQKTMCKNGMRERHWWDRPWRYSVPCSLLMTSWTTLGEGIALRVLQAWVIISEHCSRHFCQSNVCLSESCHTCINTSL